MWTTQEKELESAFIQNEMNITDLRDQAGYLQRFKDYKKQLVGLCMVGEKTKSSGTISNHMCVSRKKKEDQLASLEKDRLRHVTANPKNNLKHNPKNNPKHNLKTDHKKLQASTYWITQESDADNMRTCEQVIRLIQSFVLPAVIDCNLDV
jgi:hypothetical protein